MTRRALAVALAALLCSGCYRTIYVNLQPPGAPPPQETDETLAHYQRGGGWQSFFLYGWVPGTKLIDASRTCGGDQHVASLETEETFWQFVVFVFAGYYVNVYSPWGAVVNCDHPKPY